MKYSSNIFFLNQVMRNCWSHCPDSRPSFRVLKEQLINVSQGLLNDWLNLLRCMRLSSPSNQSILAPKSPSLGRSPSILPSSNSTSYNSATLPASHKIRGPASLPSSAGSGSLVPLSSSSPKLKRGGSSSPSTPGHLPSQSASSSSPDVCDKCSSYGHPWIEICKAIRATRGKWVNDIPPTYLITYIF